MSNCLRFDPLGKAAQIVFFLYGLQVITIGLTRMPGRLVAFYTSRHAAQILLQCRAAIECRTIEAVHVLATVTMGAWWYKWLGALMPISAYPSRHCTSNGALRPAFYMFVHISTNVFRYFVQWKHAVFSLLSATAKVSEQFLALVS